MDLVQINKEIYESGKRLENGSKQLFSLAKEMAVSEKEYRKALSIEIVKLKTEKVQATLIPDIARGNTADLKFNRDLAEARYKSARDSLEAISNQLSGLQTIIKFQQDI